MDTDGGIVGTASNNTLRIRIEFLVVHSVLVFGASAWNGPLGWDRRAPNIEPGVL